MLGKVVSDILLADVEGKVADERGVGGLSGERDFFTSKARPISCVWSSERYDGKGQCLQTSRIIATAEATIPTRVVIELGGS